MGRKKIKKELEHGEDIDFDVPYNTNSIPIVESPLQKKTWGELREEALSLTEDDFNRLCPIFEEFNKVVNRGLSGRLSDQDYYYLCTNISTLVHDIPGFEMTHYYETQYSRAMDFLYEYVTDENNQPHNTINQEEYEKLKPYKQKGIGIVLMKHKTAIGAPTMIAFYKNNVLDNIHYYLGGEFTKCSSYLDRNKYDLTEADPSIAIKFIERNK